VFNHAQVYLFLGAAITTVGIVAAFFALLRRRLDPLLLWFALFALLYGIRLEMNYQLLWGLGLRPLIFQRFVIATGFLIPIPAFFFFSALGILGRPGRIASTIVWPIVSSLAVATLLVGPRDTFRVVNNTVVITAFILIVIALVRAGAGTRDINLIRGGLFLFIVCALYDNVTMFVGRYDNVEPFSFVVLLAALGIVAGRRTLANEQQLALINKELEIAKRIQLSILPSSFPPSTNFRVTARYIPMTSVAGDFYDFFSPSDHEAGILIADVSGHGVPAALIASMVKLAATAQHANAAHPSELLLGMNSVLCGNTQSQFVTAAYVYVNSTSQELRYSAAAHPPMLLLRNGEVIEITENGLMLAAFGFSAYTTLTHRIQAGDRLVLYTDGLLEASDTRGEEYGPDRLQSLVKKTAKLTQTEAIDEIITSIQQWSSTQNDDLTILMCDCTV
jgi:phosphoserine phosphatase RsbU/P